MKRARNFLRAPYEGWRVPLSVQEEHIAPVTDMSMRLKAEQLNWLTNGCPHVLRTFSCRKFSDSSDRCQALIFVDQGTTGSTGEDRRSNCFYRSVMYHLELTSGDGTVHRYRLRLVWQ